MARLIGRGLAAAHRSHKGHKGGVGRPRCPALVRAPMLYLQLAIDCSAAEIPFNENA